MLFRQIFSQLQNLFKNISVGKRIAILILAVGSISAFIFLMSWTGKPEFHPLFTNLDSQDAGIILERLKDQKIPYRIATTEWGLVSSR